MNARRSLALGWVLAAVGCGAPPWQLGKPLDGRPSIPPDKALASPAQAAADAQKERATGRRVLEISALQRLDSADALSGSARLRLAELLTARATEFHALGRAIPESADLETVARLDPTRGAKLGPARAVAAAAAGDAWKAIGARDEARAAYMRAAALGGVPAGDVGIVPRRGAVPAVIAGQPPADIDGFVFGGASLSARLLPLVASFPWVLDHKARALFWAELLLAEDATSPDVLELVAVIWGRAGRLGGTERMLMELVYHSPDRAAGTRARRRGVGAPRPAARGLRAVDPRRALARRPGGSGVAQGVSPARAAIRARATPRPSATTSSAARGRIGARLSPPSWKAARRSWTAARRESPTAARRESPTAARRRPRMAARGTSHTRAKRGRVATLRSQPSPARQPPQHFSRPRRTVPNQDGTSAIQSAGPACSPHLGRTSRGSGPKTQRQAGGRLAHPTPARRS